MPTMTRHVLGTFCWPECATTDAAATKAFYSELLGWTWNEQDMGESGKYYMAQIQGRDVAAMYVLDDRMRAMGIPPHWGSYVSVASADESAKQAEALGGKVLMGPFDVMQHGRMAILQDPVGATFCVWQAKEHCGVGLLGEPGSLGWTQLNVTDPGRAKTFYTGLFGWDSREDADPMGGTYTTFLKADGAAGGMMAMPPGAGAPSHWLVYWSVADTRVSHAKAAALGAKTFVPPTDLPGMLTFAVMADPQGVMFALVQFHAAP